MRRRRLPARRAQTALALRPHVSDLRYLEQVVTIRFPVRAARAYLQRHMTNPVSIRLVEADRGEAVGTVRCVEIVHRSRGERSWVLGERLLADGQPATAFVPDREVRIVARIEGAVAATHRLDAEDEVVLHVAVRGLSRFVPEVLLGEGAVHASPPKGDEGPLRRFLLLFQQVMSTVTDQIDDLPDLTQPDKVDARFLPWLASWVGFDLDASLPVPQQRMLVRRAIRLMRTRGTRAGIEEMVGVLTAAPVRIEERRRPGSVILGRAHLIGGTTVEARYRRAEPAGSYLARSDNQPSTQFFTLRLESRGRFEERFGERAGAVLRRIVQVVSAERPTHVQFVVRFDDAPE